MTYDSPTKYASNKETQMKKCQHLFLKLKEGKHYYGFNSSDYEYNPCVVICLKCGLTNRFIETNSIDMEYDRIIRRQNPYYDEYRKVNGKIFKEQFGHAWGRGGKSFDDSIFNLISEEVFKANNPILLYNIAKTIKPSADDTEIFDTMKSLYELETLEEREKLKTTEQAKELIDRYKNRKVKAKIH